MNEETEFEKTHKKHKYNKLFNTAMSILLTGSVMGVVSPIPYALIKYETFHLDNQIIKTQTEVMHLEECKDILSKYKNISITGIEDIIQTKNKEIQEIKSSPTYITQEKQDNLMKKIWIYSLATFFTSAFLGVFVTNSRVNKSENELKNLKLIEEIKLSNAISTYIDKNKEFTLEGLNDNLETRKINYKLLNTSLEKELSPYLNNNKLTYDEKNKIYYSKSA